MTRSAQPPMTLEVIDKGSCSEPHPIPLLYISRVQADQQRDMFRHAQIQSVPGARHRPWLEQPGRVAAYVTEFLSKQADIPLAGG